MEIWRELGSFINESVISAPFALMYTGHWNMVAATICYFSRVVEEDFCVYSCMVAC